MITSLNEKVFHFRGLAADFSAKKFPIPIAQIGNGSTFLAMDTGILYIYDKTNNAWPEYTISGGGGGGGSEPSAYLRDAEVSADGLVITKKNGLQVTYKPSDNNYTNAAKAKVNAIPANPKYTDTTYSSDNSTININASNKISVNVANVKNAMSLATIATSGDYNDLSNKPAALSVIANSSKTPTQTLSVLEVDGIAYGVPSYAPGNGINIINNVISIDESKIATLDSVNAMLAAGLSDIKVTNESGEAVPVATTNFVRTGTEVPEDIQTGEYIFVEI